VSLQAFFGSNPYKTGLEATNDHFHQNATNSVLAVLETLAVVYRTLGALKIKRRKKTCPKGQAS
jgi:hypothetical protein